MLPGAVLKMCDDYFRRCDSDRSARRRRCRSAAAARPRVLALELVAVKLLGRQRRARKFLGVAKIALVRLIARGSAQPLPERDGHQAKNAAKYSHWGHEVSLVAAAATGSARARTTGGSSGVARGGAGSVRFGLRAKNRKLQRASTTRALRAGDNLRLRKHDAFVAAAAILANVFVDRHGLWNLPS